MMRTRPGKWVRSRSSQARESPLPQAAHRKTSPGCAGSAAPYPSCTRCWQKSSYESSADGQVLRAASKAFLRSSSTDAGTGPRGSGGAVTGQSLVGREKPPARPITSELPAWTAANNASLLVSSARPLPRSRRIAGCFLVCAIAAAAGAAVAACARGPLRSRPIALAARCARGPLRSRPVALAARCARGPLRSRPVALAARCARGRLARHRDETRCCFSPASAACLHAC